MIRKPVLCAVVSVMLLAPAALLAQVRVVRDLDYVASTEYASNKDRLDVYVPAGANRAPVILSLHGGALTQGDKAQQAFVGQRFASEGIVTVVANYRLSPAVSHPAHIEDAAASFAWTRRHIDQHGGDPARIFVIGHSAGAYLAGLLALDPRYLAAHGLKPTDIAGVVPVAGFFYVDRPGVAPDRPKTIWGADAGVWVDASPAKYVRRDVPPILLLYADGDDEWRRKQNQEFGDTLKKLGADAAVREVAGRTHGSVWSKMAEGPEDTSNAILAFVRRLARSARTSDQR